MAAPDGELSTVQAAFRDCHGLQCGFCTPGFVMSVTAFLRDHPDPTDEEIREALSGNLCRCTGYQGILRAVRQAADVALDDVGRGAGMTATAPQGAARYAGARINRVEDARLLTGHGTFVDDIVAARHAARLLRAQPVRPGRPSARSTRPPRWPSPGVHFVFTAADLNPGVKEQWHTSIGALSPETPRPPLADDEVRFVGDPVALVVADEPLPGRGRGRAGRRRLRPAARRSSTTPPREQAEALVHESHGSNVIGEIAGLPASSLDEVYAAAAHVVSDVDPPAGLRRGADGGSRPGRRLLAGHRRAHDLLGHPGAPRGAPVLLPPARPARAPDPRRHARHRRRLRPEGPGAARRDVPDARRPARSGRR